MLGSNIFGLWTVLALFRVPAFSLTATAARARLLPQSSVVLSGKQKELWALRDLSSFLSIGKLEGFGDVQKERPASQGLKGTHPEAM